MKDELIDHIDPSGKVLGIVSKHEAHRHGWLHATVIAHVHDPEGNILLVRQTPDRQEAGQYVCPVGGHIKAGETELEALRREAGEEIGITDFTHQFLMRYIFDRHIIGRHENHMFVVYRIVADPRRIVLGDESDDLRIFTPAEHDAAIAATPELFGASYLDFVSRYYQLPH